MTVREIRGHGGNLRSRTPDLISTVTDAVLEEVGEWQNRALDACYVSSSTPSGSQGRGFCSSRYIALAVLSDGTREILGLWIEQEGAKSGCAS